jgi:hypothetical protein
MNGERYPGESLPFEPSMRHADDRLIAIIRRTTYSCFDWQNEAKILNLINAPSIGAPRRAIWWRMPALIQPRLPGSSGTTAARIRGGSRLDRRRNVPQQIATNPEGQAADSPTPT